MTVATMADLKWFWGDDGKIVTDGRHIWFVRDVAGSAGAAMKAEVSDVAVFSVHESGDGKYIVETVLHSERDKPRAGDARTRDGASARLGYGDYRRLSEWAASHGIRVNNVERERRLAERHLIDAPAAVVPREVLVKRLVAYRGIATLNELLHVGAGPRAEPNADEVAHVIGSLAGIAVHVTVRGAHLFVQKQKGVLERQPKEMVRTLKALDGQTDPTGVWNAIRAFKRCAPKGRHVPLMRELGLDAVRPRKRPTQLPAADRSPHRQEGPQSPEIGQMPEVTPAALAGAEQHPDRTKGSTTPEPTVTTTASAVAGLPAIVIRHEAPPEPGSTGQLTVAAENDVTLDVYIEYCGERTNAQCIPSTGRTSIVTGPLSGVRFLDPTAAAIAVARRSSTDVPIPVNGWTSWVADDGTGRILEHCISHGEKDDPK